MPTHDIIDNRKEILVLRELRVLFGSTKDEQQKGQINILEKAFRGSLTGAANQELNKIRRNSITGQNLFAILRDIYNKHNMQDWVERRSLQAEDLEIPRIICSEALV